MALLARMIKYMAFTLEGNENFSSVQCMRVLVALHHDQSVVVLFLILAILISM
jgi:hypothetical protein